MGLQATPGQNTFVQTQATNICTHCESSTSLFIRVSFVAISLYCCNQTSTGQTVATVTLFFCFCESFIKTAPMLKTGLADAKMGAERGSQGVEHLFHQMCACSGEQQ